MRRPTSTGRSTLVGGLQRMNGLEAQTGRLAMSKITVGLDVGDRFSQICAVDAEGVVIQEGRVATTREALRERLPARPSCRIVLETGPHAGWINRELSAAGHEVLVANGRKLRWLYSNEHK